MKKRIALYLHIAMFIYDISCVQFTLNNYIQGSYNSWNCSQLLSDKMLPQSLRTFALSHRLWLLGTLMNSWPI